MKASPSGSRVLIVAVVVSMAGQLCAADVTNQPAPAISADNTNATGADKQPVASPQVAPAPAKIVYKPPLRGAPAVRIDGGSRGNGISLIRLIVLAPDHTALTVQEQPSLFWYQSEPAHVPFILTVLADKQASPVLRVKLPDANRTGIQELKLSDHHVTLASGVEYEWVVALVVDSESRSKDVVASGYIRRIEPSSALSARLMGASRTQLPYIYAEEGIWYDALTALSDLLKDQPDNAQLLADRAALLEQVGITNVTARGGSMVLGN